MAASSETTTLKLGDISVTYQKRSEKTLPPALGDVLVASDLKTGVYEGGFKIWECSIDLCRYLISDRSDLNGKRILELGCGAGLPGIVALKQGARSVCFQDFNSEVIELWTKGNVELNFGFDGPSNRCTFRIGDWNELRKNCEETGERFDIILTSETIYNVDNYEKLVRTIDSALDKSGYALLAAKSYYFGVGGNIDGFLDFLNLDRTFKADVVWSSADAAIPRQILRLSRI